MGMNRQERAALHKKQERLQITEGAPEVQDLQEGVPVLRATSEGVVEYISHNNILYKRVLEKANAVQVKPVLGESGYSVLEGGLVIQWGKVTADGSVTFLYKFPNACLNIVFGKITSDASIPRVTGMGRTGFNYSTSSVANGDSYWQAIGQ